MKKIVLFFLFFSILPAKADDIATNYFQIDAATTAQISISGNLFTTIDPLTGILSSALNINFAIATNQALSDIRLKALVKDSSSISTNAFYYSGATSTSSSSFYLTFVNTDVPPASTSIANCKSAISTSINNPNAIAYPGTVTISNGGTISYNSTNGYFSCQVPAINTTNISLSVTATPKVGTFDAITALDEAGTYKVEIYLDNLPPW